jgi:hypothetical protein
MILSDARTHLTAIAVARCGPAGRWGGDDGTIRVRGRVAGRRVRATLRIPSVLYGLPAEETRGGSARAGVVAALLRR